MPARRRSNNGGGETYLERLLAEFSGCCRPEEAQRPSYRAASPAAVASILAKMDWIRLAL